MNEIRIVDEVSETHGQENERAQPLLTSRSPHRRHRLDILNLNNIFMNEWTRHKSPREYCGTGIRLVVHGRSHTLWPGIGPGERKRGTNTVY